YPPLFRSDAGDRQAPADDRTPRPDGGVGRGDGGGVAHHRGAEGVAVEPAGVGALDVALEPAGAALEGLTVLVDQHVVADIAPAQVARVVRVDAPHDAGRLLA